MFVLFIRILCARSWRVVLVAWHLYRFFRLLVRVLRVSCRFFGLIGVYVITISRVRRDLFLLIKSRYLRCRCGVTCFKLDKIQEVRPLGVPIHSVPLEPRLIPMPCISLHWPSARGATERTRKPEFLLALSLRWKLGQRWLNWLGAGILLLQYWNLAEETWRWLP